MESENLAEPTVNPSDWLDQYGDFLYRFALSRLRSGDAAEDAVQDTLVAALNNLGQFSGRGSERAWLLGILKRKIVDFYRQRSRTPVFADEQAIDISERLFDKNGGWRREVRASMRQSLDSLDRQEFWRILKKCLDALPSRHADVFTLRVMDEREADEVCQEMEISPSNYWVILHRARLQLSSCIKRRWFQESR